MLVQTAKFGYFKVCAILVNVPEHSDTNYHQQAGFTPPSASESVCTAHGLMGSITCIGLWVAIGTGKSLYKCSYSRMLCSLGLIMTQTEQLCVFRVFSPISQNSSRAFINPSLSLSLPLSLSPSLSLPPSLPLSLSLPLPGPVAVAVTSPWCLISRLHNRPHFTAVLTSISAAVQMLLKHPHIHTMCPRI